MLLHVMLILSPLIITLPRGTRESYPLHRLRRRCWYGMRNVKQMIGLTAATKIPTCNRPKLKYVNARQDHPFFVCSTSPVIRFTPCHGCTTSEDGQLDLGQRWPRPRLYPLQCRRILHPPPRRRTRARYFGSSLRRAARHHGFSPAKGL